MNANTYSILAVLAAAAAVYGVFLSFDLFLLLVFCQIATIPKYFLIAVWGSTRREYDAMKLPVLRQIYTAGLPGWFFPVSPALCRAAVPRAPGRAFHRFWLRSRLVAGEIIH